MNIKRTREIQVSQGKACVQQEDSGASGEDDPWLGYMRLPVQREDQLSGSIPVKRETA